MKHIIFKLQWGGVLTDPQLTATTPALTLNAMAAQGASLNSIKPNFTLGDRLRNLSNSTLGINTSTTSVAETTGATGGGANPMGAIGAGLDMLSNFKVFQKNYSGKKGNLTQGLDSAYDTVSNVAMSLGPVGMIVGGAMKAGKLVGSSLEKIGIGTDKMTTADAILGSSFFNLTPTGLINNAFGKKTDTIDIDQNAVSNSSYTGTGADIQKAGQYSNKKYGLLSNRARKKANKKIGQAKVWQSGIQDILGEASDQRAIQASSTDMFNNRKQLQQSGILGGNSYITFGKKGAKFITHYRKYLKDKENDVNLLPIGALHARKHNINVEGVVTNKGIPVLMEKGGSTKQAAEIEKNEIIFRPKVTERLEELFKEGTDEAAIEAGKLLVREILYNTKDEGEFISTVE